MKKLPQYHQQQLLPQLLQAVKTKHPLRRSSNEGGLREVSTKFPLQVSVNVINNQELESLQKTFGLIQILLGIGNCYFKNLLKHP